ncbi:MAG: acetyltransferase [Nostoc sp. NMS1]|uniref:acetyltransferase n=1 Tax=unclassified Nostoc TaxID=2593658 RepID=UPI0025E9322A|nr:MULTISPECIES: acetyltransferase [unclassified Nostoc]MBN3911325.1 acetyltransferase [Nostoc sp. NMS1]MBN3995069.1 acetyltransferase [Nostoc sp. NMS2]
MFLQEKQTDKLIEIHDIETLISPLKPTVMGQYQVGEEEQDPESFEKENLIFPSGENLPRCWVNKD